MSTLVKCCYDSLLSTYYLFAKVVHILYILHSLMLLLTLEQESLQLLPVRWLLRRAGRGVTGGSVRVGGRWRVRMPRRLTTRGPVAEVSWWREALESCGPKIYTCTCQE